MRDLSDIEEGPDEGTAETVMDAEEPQKDKNSSNTKDISVFNNSCGNNNSSSNHTSFTTAESRTSKSGSCIFTVDPSVLELAKATVANEHVEDDSFQEHRMASRFCGSCCDLVRACVTVDCFFIIKNINVIITIILGLSYVRPSSTSTDDVYYDDDYYYHSKGEDYQQNGSMMFLILITKNVAGIFFATIGMVGALSFQKWLVLSTTIWCGIDVVVSVLTERWLAAVSAGFFVYPELALFLALHRSIITPENYDDIRYCCWRRCNRAQEESDDIDSDDDADVDINLDDDDENDE